MGKAFDYMNEIFEKSMGIDHNGDPYEYNDCDMDEASRANVNEAMEDGHYFQAIKDFEELVGIFGPDMVVNDLDWKIVKAVSDSVSSIIRSEKEGSHMVAVRDLAERERKYQEFLKAQGDLDLNKE